MTDLDSRSARLERRILIDSSEYWLSNIGDLAMLEVTIKRLRSRWPESRIGVLTDAPALLAAYFPDVEPIAAMGADAWSEPSVIQRISKTAGPQVVGPVMIGWLSVKVWLPQKLAALKRKLSRVVSLPSPRAAAPQRGDSSSMAYQGVPQNSLRAANTASLVLALGGGYITDIDRAQATRVLGLLGYAHGRGIPVAMVGQGMGPIDDPFLVAQVGAVLPQVDYIGLREGLRGPELLSRAGVASDRIRVTGDDAIELAYELRRDEIGSDIGICLRVAGYSPVTQETQNKIRTVLHDVAGRLHASLTPVIIAEYKSQDRRSTLPLTRGLESVKQPLGRFARVSDVVEQVGHCRVVVTGAYHAAVFAMAQGIPVVGLTTSRYYDDKFNGLASMFDGGFELVRLDTVELDDRLTRAILSAWAQAPSVRETLRARAREQIDDSRNGLDRFLDWVEETSRQRD